MEADTGTLTTVLNQFLQIFQLGRKDVGPHAWNLLSLLTTLEILLAALWWALTGSEAMTKLIKKLLTIGFFIFVIQNYDSLVSAISEGFIHTGKIASSAGGDVLSSVRDPSLIVEAGFYVALPVLDHIRGYSSWDVLWNLNDILVTGICAFGIILSYFVIAIQVFVTYLEFGMVTTLGLMLIPFGVFKHTAFLAEKLFGAIISFGIKLMVLGFIVSVTMPVMKGLAIPTDPTWTQLFNVLVVCMAVATLAWHAPGLAAGLLAGAPALTAGSAAGSAIAGAAGLESGTLMAGGATRAPGQISNSVSTLSQAASIPAGIATGGFQVAAANAALKGSGSIGTKLKGTAGGIASVGVAGFKAGISPVTKLGGDIRQSFNAGREKVRGFSALRDESLKTNAGDEKTPKGSVPNSTSENQSTPKTKNEAPKGTSSSVVDLAKKAVQPTAQPQGGTSVPLTENEEKTQ